MGRTVHCFGFQQLVVRTVFVTAAKAVDRESCGVRKLLSTGEVPKTLASIVLAVTDGLFM